MTLKEFHCGKCGSEQGREEADSIGYTITCATCGHIEYLDDRGNSTNQPALHEDAGTEDPAGSGKTTPEDQPDAEDRDGGEETGQPGTGESTSRDEVSSRPESQEEKLQEVVNQSQEPAGQPEKVQRRDRKRLGICIQCGVEPAREKYTTGERCAEVNRQYQKRHYQEKAERKKETQNRAAIEGAASEPAGMIPVHERSPEPKLADKIYSSEEITLEYLTACRDLFEEALNYVPEDKKPIMRIQLEAIRITILVIPSEDEPLAEALRNSGKLA